MGFPKYLLRLKPSVDITTDIASAIQARRYGWNAKHKLSILTNFEDLLIYDVTNKPEEMDSANVSLYKKYHYLEYVKNFRKSIHLFRGKVYIQENLMNLLMRIFQMKNDILQR